MKVIALQGTANSGKTTSIAILRDMLKANNYIETKNVIVTRSADRHFPKGKRQRVTSVIYSDERIQ